MGSGCITTTPNSSSCATITSSNCVRYQGDPVPALGICTGDNITEVEMAIINKLLSLLNGTGLTVSQVTLENCPYLKTLFNGKDNTITNLFQLLIDSQCSLKALVDQINTRTQPSNFVFDLKCLPSISSPTPEKILQALITDHCSLKTTVIDLINGGDDTTIIDTRINTALSNLITSIANKGIKKTTNSAGLTHYHFTSLVPPLGAVMYLGPLTNFDADGLGLVGSPLEGWRLLNGKGNTIDMRGFVPVGAIQGVPGGPLDSIVDPNTNGDATMNYAFGAKGGSAKRTLSIPNLPPHSHPVNDPGHSHMYQGRAGISDNANDRGVMESNGSQGTTSSTTGITIGNTGSGAPFDTRMPYKAINWIMRID